MISETVEVRGHLIDSAILSRVLDDVLDYGGNYSIDQFDVGRSPVDESFAQLTVMSEDAAALSRLVMRLQSHGVNPTNPGEAVLREVEQDGVFPDDFYSTTNLETVVRLGGHWVPVENPEMDCGIAAVDSDRARTIAVSDVRRGDRIVCGAAGVKVVPLPAIDRSVGSFEQLTSDVTAEKPQARQVRLVAQQMRDVKDEGRRILWVGGPAVVHTGAAAALEALIDAGYVDVLFAGNALATYDIEAALYGISLGGEPSRGRGVEHGHEHRIRVVNAIRKAGSIRAAVEQGLVTKGVMHALVRRRKEFVLVGSVRDDGPLPDVYTDVIEGQRAMRAALKNVGFTIMVATLQHSVATSNLLPASVPLVCVDINPATVTKLADRGSAQARGIVTDIGLFLEQLALELVPAYRAGDRPGDDA